MFTKPYKMNKKMFWLQLRDSSRDLFHTQVNIVIKPHKMLSWFRHVRANICKYKPRARKKIHWSDKLET